MFTMRSFFKSIRPLAAGVGASACVALGGTGDDARKRRLIFCELQQQSLRANIALANHHRVGLCGWPIGAAVENGDARVSTLPSLFQHLNQAGYDGAELQVGQLRDLYFKDSALSDLEIAKEVHREATEAGSQVLGALYIVTDGERITFLPWSMDFADKDFELSLREKVRADAVMGARYITFQIGLPPEYLGTAFEWRDDDAFRERTVQRLCKLADICWDEGLNVYFETHIDRISEDPVFFQRVLESAASVGYLLEVNGDLSHYIYRGFMKGNAVEALLPHVNHMHVRMARVHGDLSADVEDMDADIASGGAAASALSMSERVASARNRLAGGLSSRTVCGETGMMHLVRDPLTLDQRMVPLLRKMCQSFDCAAKASYIRKE